MCATKTTNPNTNQERTMNPNQDNEAALNTPTAADQTPTGSSGQAADSETSGKQPAGKTEAQTPSQDVAQAPTQGEAPVPASAVTPPVEQDAHNLKQAAQLEHNSSTDGVSNPSGSNGCALAGGVSPQAPQAISNSKSAKMIRNEKRDNHVSIRLTDEEWDVLESDKERHAEVTKWRAEADRLLKAIPQLEELLRLALGVMTSLTTERVSRITKGYSALGSWKANVEKKDNDLATVAFLQALMDLLTDAGIKPQQKR
jgi:hypothetical protein